jgi:hypothetical protein
MDNNVKNFLESIQDLKNTKFKVNRITTGEKVDCVPLSFKQQKNIISTFTEGTVGVLKFQKMLNDIIIENTGNNDWLVVDKIPVVLKLRKESLGDIVKTSDGEIDIRDIKILEKIDIPLQHIVEGAVTVELDTPTLSEENKVINYAIDILKKDGEKDVGKNLTNLFTFEIVKFVKSVKFGEKSLSFSELSIKDRISVIENLPLSINQDIAKFIDKIKEIDRTQTKVVIDGEEKSFDIDITFFDN